MYEHLINGKKFRFKKEPFVFYLDRDPSIFKENTHILRAENTAVIGKVEIKGQTYLEFTLVFFGKELKRSCTIKDFIKSE